MRKRTLALAILGLLAFGASPAAAADVATCRDITITFRPLNVDPGSPYSCACGPAVSTRPTPGGIVVTTSACPE